MRLKSVSRETAYAAAVFLAGLALGVGSAGAASALLVPVVVLTVWSWSPDVAQSAAPLALTAGALAQFWLDLSWRAVFGVFVVVACIARRRRPAELTGALFRFTENKLQGVATVVTALALTALGTVVLLCVVNAEYPGDGIIIFGPRPAPTVLMLAAVANGILEEIAWRLLLLDGLRALGARGGEAVMVTALSFGLAHVASGIPSGVAGLLVTTVFGLVAGMVVVYARSLLLAVVMHAWFDVVIAWKVFS